jgi:hypothetical protein
MFYLEAVRAFRGEMFFVARHAVALLFFRDETVRADRLRTRHTSETVFVKLLSAILELLRPYTMRSLVRPARWRTRRARLTWLEDLLATVATRGELLIVTFAAQQLVIAAAERFVSQWRFARRTEEALLVPMTVLVREILEDKQKNGRRVRRSRSRSRTFESVPIVRRHSSHMWEKRSS